MDLIASVKVIAVHDQLHMRNLNKCKLESAGEMANKSYLSTDLKYSSLSIRCRCWRETVSRCSLYYDDVPFGKQRQATQAGGSRHVIAFASLSSDAGGGHDHYHY